MRKSRGKSWYIHIAGLQGMPEGLCLPSRVFNTEATVVAWEVFAEEEREDVRVSLF
jgi:hypothetical protein